MLLYQPEEINKIKNPRTAGTVRGWYKMASAFLLGGTRADTTLQEMILWQKPKN